jgi:hypothetical protein
MPLPPPPPPPLRLLCLSWPHAAGLLRCERALAFEGGHFLWSGVRLGYRRNVGHDPVSKPGAPLN